MIRLRQSLDAGLRHPLLGPLLLLVLALLLSFLFLHVAEHELERLLLTCAVLAAVALRLVLAPEGRLTPIRPIPATTRRGSPPPAVARAMPPPPSAVFALPLRR